MRSLYELKEMLSEELDKIAEKGELSPGSLETIHKLTDTIKNIDKIEMLEDAGYSEGGWEDQGSHGRGSSYGGTGHATGGSYARGGSYADGMSYARGGGRGRHYVRAHYSRDDGRGYMMSQLEDIMRNADGKDREAIRRCIDMLKNA